MHNMYALMFMCYLHKRMFLPESGFYQALEAGEQWEALLLLTHYAAQ